MEEAGPDDHFVPSPHCRLRVSRRGRVGEGCCDPAIRVWVVCAARVRVVERFIDSTPDNHFAAGPYCRVSNPTQNIIGNARGSPTVRAWIVSAASV